MGRSGFLVLALTASCVATSALDEGLSEEEQAEWDGGADDPGGEVIVLEGETGWPDWWFPGPGTPQDPGETGDGYGGGGPGPGPGGGPKPARRDCQREKVEFGPLVCRDCCAWNHDNIDDPACDEYIFPVLRKLCRQTAIATEGACSAMCSEPDEGILTISVP